MVSSTNEQALEAAIELALTGMTTEAVRGAGNVAETPAKAMVADNGFKMGVPSDFDAQYALDTRFFWQFLESTQADALARLQKHNPTDWQRKILERFDRLIKKHGILHLLKKGLQVDDAQFHLMYPAPLASSSDKVKMRALRVFDPRALAKRAIKTSAARISIWNMEGIAATSMSPRVFVSGFSIVCSVLSK